MHTAPAYWLIRKWAGQPIRTCTFYTVVSKVAICFRLADGRVLAGPRTERLLSCLELVPRLLTAWRHRRVHGNVAG